MAYSESLVYCATLLLGGACDGMSDGDELLMMSQSTNREDERADQTLTFYVSAFKTYKQKCII